MDSLTRAVPFALERSADGDGLTLTGYAAVFNEPTRIDSWEGKFDEQIARGAFKRTINARTPVLQFDHGHHPMVGSIPLGSIDKLREDDRGLYVEARLHDNWLVAPVRDAIASGAVDGMSFRFQVIKEAWDESGDVPMRTIHEVRLFELGPVVFPAYESTSVGVRSLLDSLPADAVEVLRAHLLGTPDDSASEGPAAGPDPLTHSGHNPGERARVLRSLQLEGVLS